MGLLRRAIGRLGPLTGATVEFPEGVQDLDESAAEALAGFLREELANAARGAPFVVDKTPDGARDLGFAAWLLPEARVLWCRRDPLDTCLSCYQQQFRGAIPYAYDLDHLAVAYREVDRIMRHWPEQQEGHEHP